MLEAFALSDMGCVRTNNEDYCQLEPELGLYLLADGMGGAKAGECASRMAVETVAEQMLFAEHRDARVLVAAIEQANRRVNEAAAADAALEGMGTTLVAALDLGEELSIASVGDSRAYLLDENGFRAITDDQTWVNEVGRPLGLDETALRTHPMRHVLTMAIGASSALTIHCYSVRLSRGAEVLMSSDGLHGVVEAGALEELVRAGGPGEPLERKARRLIEAARASGGPDNVTVILLRAS